MAYMDNYELAAAVRNSVVSHSSSMHQFSFPWNGRGFAFSPQTSSLLHNRCSSEFGSAMAAVKAAGCFGAKDLQEFYSNKTNHLYSSSTRESGEDPISAYYCRDSDSSVSQFPWSQTSAKQERSDGESIKFSQGASVIAPFSNFAGAIGNLSSSLKVEKHDQFSLSMDKSASAMGLISSEKIMNTSSPKAPIFLKDQNQSEPSSHLGDQTKDQQSIPTSEHPAPKRRKIQPQKQVVYVPLSSGAIRPNGGGGVSSDVWAWRKYGQKPIKGSPYPRGYYRCSSSKGCSARKQVEKSRTDPSMLIVTYTSEHNHPLPNAAALNSSPSTPSAENNINSIPEEKPITHEQEGQDSYFCTDFPDASPDPEEAKLRAKSMQKLICDEQAIILAQGSDHELKKLSKKLTAQDEDFFATLEELTVSTSPLFKTSLVDQNTDDEVSGGVVIDSYHIFSWAGDGFAERPDHSIAQF